MSKIIPEGYRKEEKWKNRCAYWMAAVGSAVGLGNIWRFPSRVYLNGGGAFLFAYFVILFLVGMPMLTQEMALGQKFQGGDVEAYGRINWRFRGVGLASVVGVYIIVTYYSVIIAYSLVYAVRSFESPQPWAYNDAYGNYTECRERVAVAKAEPDYNTTCTKGPGPCYNADCETSAADFFQDMTKLAPDIYSGEGVMSWPLVLSSVFCWIFIYFSVVKGVTSVSYVVYVTVPVPVLFLLIMMIKALTLDGSDQGISDYLTTDFSKLADAQLWLDATSQCFFSLSVCMGVMTAYASFNQSGSVALDEKVVAFADVSIAFVSGFCIYGVLGHLNLGAVDDGDDINYSKEASTSLVFKVFPEVLLTFEAAGFFSFVFFFMLFLLGIDSAFSMIEACTTVICDTDFAANNGWTKGWVALVLCILGFAIAVRFCTDVGPYHMDLFDDYVNTKGMIFVGIMEAFSLGWVYQREKQCEMVGSLAVNIFNIGYWGSLVCAIFYSFLFAYPRYEVKDGEKSLVDFNKGLGHSAVWIGFTICVIGWSASVYVALQKAKAFDPKLTTLQALWGIAGWIGAEDIREHVNSGGVVDGWKTNTDEEIRIWTRCDFSKLSIIWGGLIKFFIPGFLFTLLSDQLRKEHYQPLMGLKTGSPYQLEGMIPFILMLICVFTVMAFPRLMEQDYDRKENTGGKAVEAEMADVETREYKTESVGEI